MTDHRDDAFFGKVFKIARHRGYLFSVLPVSATLEDFSDQNLTAEISAEHAGSWETVNKIIMKLIDARSRWAMHLHRTIADEAMASLPLL